jgi:hypothetical protein
VAVFASSGDDGFQLAGQGPQYPSTSQHVISVGGTVLVPAGNARGWSETAWDRAGSSCSDGIAPLASQATAACARRASADISAIAGEPGLAVYNKGSWVDLLGTSAASPLVAAMFAASGNGGATPDSISRMTSALTDVVGGSNGSCASELCRAGAGWDGPTGYGTPIADALEGADPGPAPVESATVTSPVDGDTVEAGFTVELDIVGDLDVVVSIDGAQIGEAARAPYRFATPADLAAGDHEIEVVATDAQGNSGSIAITVTVTAADPTGPAAGEGTDEVGGCSAGGGGAGGIVLAWYAVLGCLWFAARSRRRPARAPMAARTCRAT